MTVAELVSRWLDQKVCRQATRIEYARQVRSFITPAIGTLDADALRPMDLAAFYRELRFSAAQRSHTVLGQAFDWGILNELVVRASNPARVARPRRAGATDGDPDAHSDALVRPADPQAIPTVEEIELLLDDAIRKPPWWLYLRIAPCAGARPGEMGALQRWDLDCEGCTIRIVREANRHAGRITRVKNVHSERVLHLAPELFADIAPVVRSLRPDEYLFPADERMRLGRPARLPCWTANGAAQRLRSACRRVGLRPYTPKAFRHFCATHLLAAGLPPSQVARFLGHANDYMVRTLYGRWIVEEAQRAIGLLAGGLVRRHARLDS